MTRSRYPSSAEEAAKWFFWLSELDKDCRVFISRLEELRTQPAIDIDLIDEELERLALTWEACVATSSLYAFDDASRHTCTARGVRITCVEWIEASSYAAVVAETSALRELISRIELDDEETFVLLEYWARRTTP